MLKITNIQRVNNTEEEIDLLKAIGKSDNVTVWATLVVDGQETLICFLKAKLKHLNH